MTIGFNIKRLRGEKRLTQGKLAENSKLGLNMVSKLERDETDPRLSSLYKLMNALECSADDLITDEKQSSFQGKLNRQFKRASTLPEHEQEILMTLIEKYCNAVVYELMIDNGDIPK